ncbi:hypothetical protein OG427_01285 [Streptomyces sp. NBC_00133]|uniref:hypothetical protein n=1 Tax=Streptomyces sp. NBC_00133 TaxID=2903624 RepID=UPI00324BEC77
MHAELGELVAGARPGRTAADQITLYKSAGVAVQDAAAAAQVIRAARERQGEKRRRQCARRRASPVFGQIQHSPTPWSFQRPTVGDPKGTGKCL